MDWIPAISTTTLLATILWFCRNLITTRLTNAVRHEYNEKIENLKAELRKSEEIFKSELREKEKEIEVLRGGALSGLANRQALLYQRQIDAAEKLWDSVISLYSAKHISSLIGHLNLDVVVERAKQDENLQELFKDMEQGLDIGDFRSKKPSALRPFVSHMAWAYYTAYESIILYSVAMLKVLKRGLDKELIKEKEIIDLVKTVLPHREEYIAKYGIGALHFLLEEIESKLLTEIDCMLRGVYSDDEDLERMADILKKSKQLYNPKTSVDLGNIPLE